MSYFIRRGNKFSVTDKASLDIHESLPPGTYAINFAMGEGFFLERVDAFEMPPKLYGSTIANGKRILDTFLDRPNTTGVLLEGEKGSGKSLLAKHISSEALKQGVSTLIVNSSFVGHDFFKFIQSIDEPAVVLFDEFEKVYNEKAEQRSILTLFDGVYPTKKLFVLTVNDKWSLDTHFHNRPGRLYYSLTFDRLETDFIREYCEDVLKNKTHIDAVIKVAAVFAKFNFDMLKAIVEEMNRYDESPQEVLRLLNCNPESSNDYYETSVTYKGKAVSTTLDTYHRGSPVTQSQIRFGYDTAPEESDDSNWVETWLNAQDLVQFKPESGTFVFKKDDLVVTFKRPQQQKFNYYDAF